MPRSQGTSKNPVNTSSAAAARAKQVVQQKTQGLNMTGSEPAVGGVPAVPSAPPVRPPMPQIGSNAYSPPSVSVEGMPFVFDGQSYA
jgi:hypothetical protein